MPNSLTGRPALLLLLLGLAPLPVRAADPPSITWLHTTPRAGDAAPETSEDGVLHWLMDRLPAYHHTIVTADPARMMALLQSTDGVCHPTIVKTVEREAFIAFSQRLAWGLPARVVVLDAQAARFDTAAGTAGALDLDRLLNDADLTGAFETARSLVPAIAEVLTRHRGDGHLVETASAPNMYAMLAGGRVDWVIGWPDETKQVLRAEYPDTQVRSYAIAGSAAPRAGYAGCSKGPQGQRIIADIDRVLHDQHVKDPVQGIYDRWLDPADQAALHRAIVEAERGE